LYNFKAIICLLTNPHYPTRPIVLALRENKNFSANDCGASFIELFSYLEVSPIVICSVIIDGLSAQFHGLDRVLSQSVILQVKCFAHRTGLVLVTPIANASFA
jgi:hypothetical protein